MKFKPKKPSAIKAAKARCKAHVDAGGDADSKECQVAGSGHGKATEGGIDPIGVDSHGNIAPGLSPCRIKRSVALQRKVARDLGVSLSYVKAVADLNCKKDKELKGSAK